MPPGLQLSANLHEIVLYPSSFHYGGNPTNAVALSNGGNIHMNLRVGFAQLGGCRGF